MQPWRASDGFLRYLARGAAGGIVILGIGGRLVMTLFALITGVRPAFTVPGTAAVVVSGALYGLAGGVFCWALDRHTRIHFWPRAVLGGAALCVGIAAVAVPNNQAGAALEQPVLTIALFVPLAIGFAAAVQRRRRVQPAAQE